MSDPGQPFDTRVCENMPKFNFTDETYPITEKKRFSIKTSAFAIFGFLVRTALKTGLATFSYEKNKNCERLCFL